MPDLIRRCGAEFVGTFMLVFVGVGAIAADASGAGLGAIGISLAFGAVVAAMVYATGHISGAHLNPAVTLGFSAAGRMSPRDALAYAGTQIVAATAAALLLDAVVGLTPAIGVTAPSVPIPGAIVVELVTTFGLMFVIMAVATDPRASPALAGVAIGLAVAMGALMGGAFTGASMNPARSFGPAFATGSWNAHWLYWAAPGIGALLAVGCYGLLGGGRAGAPAQHSGPADLEP